MLVDVREGDPHRGHLQFLRPSIRTVRIRNLIGVVEQNQVDPRASVSIGSIRYRGRSNPNDTGIAANDQIRRTRCEIKGSISYITGSHAFKVGISDFRGIQTYNSPEMNNALQHPHATTASRTRSPSAQNQYMGIKGGVRAELGVFVQDRWTVKPADA